MFTYHHFGIPTKDSHPDEKYTPDFKMTTWGYETSEFRVQWMRFDNDCELHPLIQTVPHVAFLVEDLEEALKGRHVIHGPTEPLEGFRVAFIEDGGAPIELIETNLTEEEIITQAEAKKAPS